VLCTHCEVRWLRNVHRSATESDPDAGTQHCLALRCMPAAWVGISPEIRLPLLADNTHTARKLVEPFGEVKFCEVSHSQQQTHDVLSDAGVPVIIPWSAFARIRSTVIASACVTHSFFRTGVNVDVFVRFQTAHACACAIHALDKSVVRAIVAKYLHIMRVEYVDDSYMKTSR
jgi:hypothetical protein